MRLDSGRGYRILCGREASRQLFDMWIQLYRLNKCMEVSGDTVILCFSGSGGCRAHLSGKRRQTFDEF